VKIVCIGAGPAGLYFAISMKLRDPTCAVEVYERNRADDTYGWGVVFSDQTMDNLAKNDPETAQQILDHFAHWDEIEVHFKGKTVRSTGHGFCGIGRQRLLTILQGRALALSVKLVFEAEIDPANLKKRFPDADLILAADGANSRMRSAFEKDFKPDIDVRKNKYIWLGTEKAFEAFTFAFLERPEGLIWAHAYRFEKGGSTFIAECSEKTWKAFGFERMTQDETCRALEGIFADHLDGHKLISNAKHLRGSAWLNFPRILCEKWFYENIILIGDAAHTAHFSIGSGTKLALEDAIKLADVLTSSSLPLAKALAQYQEERNLEVVKLQSAARNSTEWFENVARYMHFAPIQFAYSLLTRSQRVSHENLRLRDKAWLEGAETWFAEKAFGRAVNKPVPPMFTPFRLREMELKNRVVVSPMCMYSAKDGTPNEFHFVHLGSRAMGGAGLVYTEMTDITPDARISPGCTGLYSDEHVTAWKRIVDFVHAQTSTKIALQLAHAGRKGSTKLLWEGMDEPLETGNWPLYGPSPIPWGEANQAPIEMTRADMTRIRDDFVAATRRAVEAGFDMLELHCAHGYLLSTFITPLSNARTDAYGGSLENRLRYPLEVFRAMRETWPKEKPMSVRISATDWVGEQGVTPEEAVAISAAFAAEGADLIDVSAGQTSPRAKPVYGRMFQTPFSDRIRNEAGLATMAVGNIYEVDHVNSILMAGRADLCCLARPHLLDPYWTLRAAASLGYRDIDVPIQYQAGFAQLERNLARQAEQQKAAV
jgi:anthraniloyl-CoA monooxygenase